MLVGLHGPTLSLEPGDEYPDCDPAEATRLVAAGFAAPLVDAPAARAKRQAKARQPIVETRAADAPE